MAERKSREAIIASLLADGQPVKIQRGGIARRAALTR